MAEVNSPFAKRMMAQKLMMDNKPNPFEQSEFFQPSDALEAPRVTGMLLPFSARRFGDEKDLRLAVPELVSDFFDATVGNTGKALRGELGIPSVNNPAFTGAVADMGANIAGGGLLSSKLPNAVPENALGIFAGKSAKTFPVSNQTQNKTAKILEEQNNLMGEYSNVNQQLSIGRMQLGDELTDQLAKRKNELMDKMDANSSEINKLDDESINILEKKFQSTDEQTFFKQTDDEFGKGLFKLPDNQFRFEIDDRPANIKLNISDDANVLSNQTTTEALEKVLPRTDIGVTKELDKFLDHDELFKAYPQLRKYPVKIKFDTQDSARGSFNPSTNQITINLADMRPFTEGSSITGKTLKKDIKSVLMHEIQHAVQEIEGFARGSNPRVSNADTAVLTVVKQRQDIILKNQAGHNTYNAARADLVNLGGAERIKYYEQKSLLDNHQPRLLFNQSNWYKYGNEISREVSQELGYAYKKRKSLEREKWISRAFAKLAEKERLESPVSARLADTLSMKEIKSQYGKASRITDKNYKSFADYRNARTSLDQIQNDYRYATGNPQKEMNIYRDSLGEVEARAVQARVEPTDTNRFFRSYFPPNQFQQGSMESPPPFGLKNTLRQEGGFFRD